MPISMCQTPSPVGHRWKVENDTIIPVLFDGLVCAEVLRERVCSCRVVTSATTTVHVELIVYCVQKFVLAEAMTNAEMN